MSRKIFFLLATVGIIFIIFSVLFGFILKQQKTPVKKIEQIAIGDEETVDKFETTKKNSNKSLQYFNDPNLGISFEFSPFWSRPKVTEQEDSIQIEFYNGVTIFIGENINTTLTNKDIQSISVPNSSNSINILYNPNITSEDEIIQIKNSIKIVPTPTTFIVPSTELSATIPPPTYLSPTRSYPTSRPTPNPTEFYSSSAECTYGCLSETKFQ